MRVLTTALIVKFHEMLYTLLSGHPLQVWRFQALCLKIDFADQGFAVEDQDTKVEAFDTDPLAAQHEAYLLSFAPGACLTKTLPMATRPQRLRW